MIEINETPDLVLPIIDGIDCPPNMIGHKVKAQPVALKTEWSGNSVWIGPCDLIEGYLLAWNADGTVFVNVENKVVRCLGEGMEFVE